MTLSKAQNIKKKLINLVLISTMSFLTTLSTAQAETPQLRQFVSEAHISDIRSDEQYLVQRALIIQQHLANKNFSNLTAFIHPTKGVRFSMYAYVNPKIDKVFSKDQFEEYLREDKIKFTWGEQDGTGDLYITTLPDYLDNWLQAEVYTDYPSNISLNEFIGRGNSLNNLTEIYPNADFVELHNKGINPDYAGMDWRSLRLVFEPYQGEYYLVAIINDNWTT